MTAPTFPIQTLTSQLLEQTGPYAGREISSIQLADNLREAQLLAAPQILDWLTSQSCSDVFRVSSGPVRGIKGEPLAFEIQRAGKTLHVHTRPDRWRSWLALAALVVVEIPPGLADPDQLAGFIGSWKKTGRRCQLVLLFRVKKTLQQVLECRSAADPDLELPLYLTPGSSPDPVSALRELEAEVLQSPEALSHQPICQIHLPEREPNG